ncbi:MAG: hypothetical protein LBQ39_03215 [Tannerellaceae bacterium]|jgi:hypothetical protein|nr:hypothetical protein [Tannerellaceae bacterium]
MKTSGLFLVLMVITFTINRAFSQTVNAPAYLDSLPAIELDKSQARSYRMVTDYYDFDLSGDFRIKIRMAGNLTCKSDSVQWKNVYLSSSRSLDTEFPIGKRVDYMEGFTYQQGADIISADFFRKNLPEADPLAMNLIWDVMGFDVFAYECWDSLRLNTEFRAVNANSEMEIAYGTFDNKDTRITWLGITESNNEICAILKYSVMNNPLNLEYGNITMKGRSHYWGEVYVSLSDKQIEYANLTEDVLMSVKEKDQSERDIKYTVRHITMSKINDND